MKTRFIFFIVLFFLLGSLLHAEKVEFQLSYGSWTLSPFMTAVEKKTENLIKEELGSLLRPIMYGGLQALFQSDVNLRSSGRTLGLAVWYNLAGDRFSLGLRGDYCRLNLPFSLDVEEAVNFLEFPLATLRTQAEGEVHLRSFMITALARWAALELPGFRVFLQAGVTALPYDGDIELSQTTVIRTPLGKLEYSGSLDHTFEQVRELGLKIPSRFWTPLAGISFQGRFRSVGLVLDISFSQGSYISAGLLFAL